VSKVNDFLNLRFKTAQSAHAKMTQLAERSGQGDLSSFAGIFHVTALGEKEESELKNILTSFRPGHSYNVDADLKLLSIITSEVKAIANQAIILHGERIKKAQEILKAYREGAFTTWLYAAYGNRQTPYNFLQYYEFYCIMPQILHAKIDQMPRQAIYTLASRNGALDKKKKIVQGYTGQPKNELLKIIRHEFPLAAGDKRSISRNAEGIRLLKKALEIFQHRKNIFSPTEKKEVVQLLDELYSLYRT